MKSNKSFSNLKRRTIRVTMPNGEETLEGRQIHWKSDKRVQVKDVDDKGHVVVVKEFVSPLAAGFVS